MVTVTGMPKYNVVEENQVDVVWQNVKPTSEDIGGGRGMNNPRGSEPKRVQKGHGDSGLSNRDWDNGHGGDGPNDGWGDEPPRGPSDGGPNDGWGNGPRGPHPQNPGDPYGGGPPDNGLGGPRGPRGPRGPWGGGPRNPRGGGGGGGNRGDGGGGRNRMGGGGGGGGGSGNVCIGFCPGVGSGGSGGGGRN